MFGLGKYLSGVAAVVRRGLKSLLGRSKGDDSPKPSPGESVGDNTPPQKAPPKNKTPQKSDDSSEDVPTAQHAPPAPKAQPQSPPARSGRDESTPSGAPPAKPHKTEKWDDALASYLGGDEAPMSSSNVSGSKYDSKEKYLEVGFVSGKRYGYQGVSSQEATNFFSAKSKGSWVWDNLRRRGTVFGYQKPYAFISGKSKADSKPPKYYEDDTHREDHRAIGPGGDTPASWKAGKGPYKPTFGVPKATWGTTDGMTTGKTRPHGKTDAEAKDMSHNKVPMAYHAGDDDKAPAPPPDPNPPAPKKKAAHAPKQAATGGYTPPGQQAAPNATGSLPGVRSMLGKSKGAGKRHFEEGGEDPKGGEFIVNKESSEKHAGLLASIGGQPIQGDPAVGDNVPVQTSAGEVRATAGEFIVPKEEAAKNRGLLERVNRDKEEGGGVEVGHYAEGGPVFGKQRQENFDKWFGDSKIADINGVPKKVYHGTQGVIDFDQFRTTGVLDFGSHFGTLSQADDFASSVSETSRIYPSYLSIQNPIRFDDLGVWDWDNVTKAMKDQGLNIPDRPKYDPDVRLSQKGKEHEALRRSLEENGYDGIVYKNTQEGNKKEDSYIALRPNQIKSATGNRGTFSPDDPRIHMAQGGFTGASAKSHHIPLLEGSEGGASPHIGRGAAAAVPQGMPSPRPNLIEGGVGGHFVQGGPVETPAPAPASEVRAEAEQPQSVLGKLKGTPGKIKDWMKKRYGAKNALGSLAFGQAATWVASPVTMAATGWPLPPGAGMLTGLAAAELRYRLMGRGKDEPEMEDRPSSLDNLPKFADSGAGHYAEGGPVFGKQGQKKAAAMHRKHDDLAKKGAFERKKELISMGHDGVVTSVGKKREYVAFHPHQIKSATGNRGAFSPDDPRIHYATGGPVGDQPGTQPNPAIGSGKKKVGIHDLFHQAVKWRGLKGQDLANAERDYFAGHEATTGAHCPTSADPTNILNDDRMEEYDSNFNTIPRPSQVATEWKPEKFESGPTKLSGFEVMGREYPHFEKGGLIGAATGKEPNAHNLIPSLGKYSKKDKMHLDGYQGGNGVNDFLRGYHYNQEEEEETGGFDESIKTLDSLMARSRKNNHPAITVYRGGPIPGSGKDNKNLRGMIGKTIQDPGYISTSTSKEFAKGWGSSMDGEGNEEGLGVTQIIHVPAGEAALSLPNFHRDVESSDDYWDQEEVVLDRGTPLRINSITGDVAENPEVDMDVLPKSTGTSEGIGTERHFATGGQVDRGDNFKKWFGDSKVSDSAGNPKTVYHGRTTEFDAFDKKRVGSENGTVAGRGFYFAEDRQLAESFNDYEKPELMVKANLAIRNPFDMDKTYGRDEAKRIGEAGASQPNFMGEWYKEYPGINEDKVPGLDLWRALNTSFKGKEDANAVLEEAGYDGLVHSSSSGFGCIADTHRGQKAKAGRVWVAFRPNQVKSIKNNGEYNPEDDNMHRAQGGFAVPDHRHFETGGRTKDKGIPSIFGTKRPEYPQPPPLWTPDMMEMFPKDAMQAVYKKVAKLFPGEERNKTHLAQRVAEYVSDWSTHPKNVYKRVLGNMAERDDDLDLSAALPNVNKIAESAREYQPSYPDPVAIPIGADGRPHLKRGGPTQGGFAGDTSGGGGEFIVNKESSSKHRSLLQEMGGKEIHGDPALGDNVPVSTSAGEVKTTAGEFIIPAKAAQENAGLVDAVNRDNDKPAHFASGGAVASPQVLGDVAVSPQTNDKSVVSSILKKLSDEISDRQVSNMIGGYLGYAVGGPMGGLLGSVVGGMLSKKKPGEEAEAVPGRTPVDVASMNEASASGLSEAADQLKDAARQLSDAASQMGAEPTMGTPHSGHEWHTDETGTPLLARRGSVPTALPAPAPAGPVSGYGRAADAPASPMGKIPINAVGTLGTGNLAAGGATGAMAGAGPIGLALMAAQAAGKIAGSVRDGFYAVDGKVRSFGEGMAGVMGVPASISQLGGSLYSLFSPIRIVGSLIGSLANPLEMVKSGFAAITDVAGNVVRVFADMRDPSALLRQSVSPFQSQVAAYNPAAVERMNIAFDNLSAAAGRIFEPIIEGARGFADELNVLYTAIAPEIRTSVESFVRPMVGFGREVAVGFIDGLRSISVSVGPVVAKLLELGPVAGAWIGGVGRVTAFLVDVAKPALDVLVDSIRYTAAAFMAVGMTLEQRFDQARNMAMQVPGVQQAANAGNAVNQVVGQARRWMLGQAQQGGAAAADFLDPDFRRNFNNILNEMRMPRQPIQGEMTFAAQPTRHVGIEQVGMEARAAAFSQGMGVQEQQLQVQQQIQQNIQQAAGDFQGLAAALRAAMANQQIVPQFGGGN